MVPADIFVSYGKTSDLMTSNIKDIEEGMEYDISKNISYSLDNNEFTLTISDQQYFYEIPNFKENEL